MNVLYQSLNSIHVKSWFFLLLLSLLTQGSIASDHPVLAISAAQQDYNLAKTIMVLEDSSAELSYEDVSSAQYRESFQRLKGREIDFGFSNSAYWLKSTIYNATDRNQHYFLEIANKTIYYVDMYFVDDSKITHEWHTGSWRPYNQRPIKNKYQVFPVLLYPRQTIDIFIRIKSNSPLGLPINLLTHDTFHQQNETYNQYLWLLIGMVFSLLLYNLFLSISIGEIGYRYYVAYLVVIVIFLLNQAGVIDKYLFPDQATKIPVDPLVISLMFILLNQFSRVVLRTHHLQPQWDKVIRIVLGLLCLCPIFTELIVYTNSAILTKLTLFLFLIGQLTLMITSVRALILGYRPARYFLAAWLTVVLSTAYFIIAPWEALGFQDSRTILYISYVAETILLSFALADRINLIKEERELARNDAFEQQKQSAIKERETNQKLRRMDQLKDEFLANTSHELRTPLHGIIGLSESMLDNSAGDFSEPQKHRLRLIITSAQRLFYLVNDILDISKLKERDLQINPQPKNLRAISQLVIDSLHPMAAQKQIQFVHMIDNQLPLVYADENRLQQIFYNLIGNAIKYTESGTITLSAKRVNEHLNICVKDTGIGIEIDQHKSIFNKFFQGDQCISQRFEGAGLGLSLVRQLVELQGGEIYVESQVGQGSKFFFTLPISNDDTITPTQSITVSDSRQYTGINPKKVEHEFTANCESNDTGKTTINRPYILIVDDDPINQQVLQDYLGSDYEMEFAQDGIEALEQIEGESNFDLVILDLMMPRMNGYEACKNIRKSYSPTSLPILMLTARTQTEDLTQGLSLGANDYLTKPVRRDELLARIATHIKIKHLSQIEKEKQQLLLILNQVDWGVVSFNRDTTINFSNRKFLEQLGYTINDLVDRPLSNVIPAWSQFSDTNQIVDDCALTGKPADANKIEMVDSNGQLQTHYIQFYYFNSGTEQVGILCLLPQPALSNSSTTAFDEEKQGIISHQMTNWVGRISEATNIEEAQQPPPNDIDDKSVMVKALNLSLQYWQRTTNKGKKELIEESGIWRGFTDKAGTYRSRTFDRYLNMKSLPKNPRWRNVLRTGYYVLENCHGDNALKMELEALIDLLLEKQMSS